MFLAQPHFFSSHFSHAARRALTFRDNGGMRVIAGKFRSRLLVAPRGPGTRPTSDRLRETLFNILAARTGIERARFVDLFAGTGAVGIEAASRGAAHVWLAEKAEPALTAIRANLKALGIANGVEIEPRGSGALLERLAKAVERTSPEKKTGLADVVFLDPPWEADAEYARTLEFLGSGRGRAMLAENAIIIAEHSAKKGLAAHYGALTRTRELKQGDAALSFYALKSASGLL
jgi:16S rRNA (guanine966-N2)-methyltransferase